MGGGTLVVCICCYHPKFQGPDRGNGPSHSVLSQLHGNNRMELSPWTFPQHWLLNGWVFLGNFFFQHLNLGQVQGITGVRAAAEPPLPPQAQKFYLFTVFIYRLYPLTLLLAQGSLHRQAVLMT